MTNPIATDLESIFKHQTCQWCEDVVLSAVNEIEVITLERDQARHERDELLKQRFEVDEVEENARRRVETAFRSERDEARRMYCSMVENNARQYGTSAQSVAKQAGWDCYKEETT